MVIGIISEDKTDCIAIENLIKRITGGVHTFHYCPGPGKASIIHRKKNFASLLSNLKCDKVLIVRDSDGKDVTTLRTEIEMAYSSTPISSKIFVSIAVEEIESWLLGDIDAVIKFYDLPSHSKTTFATRPDEIQSPKECLKAYVKKRAQNPIQYVTSHAGRIVEEVNIQNIYNRSPSFVTFHDAILANIH